MRVFSFEDENIILFHLSEKKEGSFVTENEAVTKYLINFKSLDHVLTSPHNQTALVQVGDDVA
jgi:hypothetical protein